MENSELRERLRLAERAAAAPYVDYPPIPRWYPWAAGLWAAAFTLTIASSDSHPALRGAGLCVLALGPGVLVWWDRRRRGTWPTGWPPAEIRRAMAGYLVGAAAVIVGVGLLVWLTPAAVAAAAAFVAVTPCIAWYERAYARAATRTRERLG